MSDFITEELMIQILKRVPPKSLLCFRCVSSSHDFISLHTQWTFMSKTSTQSSPRMLIRHYSRRRKAENYSAHHNDDLFAIDNDVKIVFPCRHYRSKGFFRIVGSCIGLVCLSDGRNQVMFWNPSIRRKIILPLPQTTFMNTRPHYSVLGFGYDVRMSDFTVVRLTYIQWKDGDLPPIVESFSLSTGTWREINIPLQNWVMGYPPTQAFVNGKVHWIAYGETIEQRILIQVFDISNEVFEEIQLPIPDVLVRKRPMRKTLAVYEHSLAVLLDYCHPLLCLQCCIWVMKEYGVEKSWIKMFNVHFGVESGRVLGFRKNGQILLTVRKGKLVSYDPRTRSIMALGVFGTSDYADDDLYADTYIESITLINEGA